MSKSFPAIFLVVPYPASRTDLSLLLGSVFAGGALGAPLPGWFADRYGCRIALQLALLILALSSLAVAASDSIPS